MFLTEVWFDLVNYWPFTCIEPYSYAYDSSLSDFIVFRFFYY